MNHLLNLAAALVFGFITGLFFFGGLWWTVQKAISQSSPLIFLASFGVRMATVGVIVLLFRSDWKALILLLGGFIAARVVIVAKISNRARRV